MPAFWEEAMALTIRAARPEDADFVSWSILASQRGHLSRGWIDIALDRSEAECLAFVRRLTATATRSWWHTSRFFIAEADGIAAAALCGLPAGDALAASQVAIKEAAAVSGLDAGDQAAIWQRGAYAATCWMHGDDHAWLIEHVATLPSHRRRGLALSLLEHVVAAGRAYGCKTAQITFYIGNEAAKQSYVRAGFRFAEEKRHPDFEAATGAPGFCRYEREI
jgi:GNAT superfamily N-acetyltransferase